MAIKNYVVQNKRKSTCIFVMLLFFIASVFIVLHTKNTNAGVYIQDENNKYKQIYEINVLEIVAKDGQQVLGYTVKGQEPITIEKIEEYTGPADLTSADFKNATGYNVIKDSSTNMYKVESSYLNTSFNENVLGESMADGEIKVKAVQANALTKEDIDWADLIYINSYDSNPNLLYYYDQIMCDGSMGVVEGDYGPTYNHSMVSDGLKKDIATKLISTSAGLNNLKSSITKQMFSYLEIESYNEVNYERYIEELEKLEVESLRGETLEEAYINVEGFMLSVYADIKSEAYLTIGTYTTTPVEDLTDEQKAEVLNALNIGMYKDYNPLNIEVYYEELRNYPSGIVESQIEEIITIANGTATTKALEQLLVIKTKSIEAKNSLGTDLEESVAGLSTEGEDTENSSENEIDENGLTEEDYIVLENCFKTLNFDIKEELVSKYIAEFVKEEFIYDVVDSTKISNLINNINSTESNLVLTQLFDCIGNEEKVVEFANNGEKKFGILEVKEYNQYSYQSYIDNLSTIEDIDSDGKISTEEVEVFVNKVNNMESELTEPYDISWFVAEYLYSAVGSKKVALMYNSQLLTDMQLGKYGEDLSEMEESETTDEPIIDNTNNMYKMLLLLRQIRYDYYDANIKSSIDKNGVYYDGGYDTTTSKYLGNAYDSWNMYTFRDDSGGDFDNYEKYREPEVVGETFTETGTKGLIANYVQDRVYSYSGEQFFGGENFVGLANADTANFKSKNTATSTTYIGNDNVLSNPAELNGFSKGDIIRYILEVSLMQLDSPLRVLEIQPAAAVSDFSDNIDTGLPKEFTATIRSCYNKKYLYIKDNTMKNSQAIVASNSNKTTWRFKLNSDGTYTIYCNANTNYAIDVHGANSNAGTAVEIYSSNGGNNQKWKIVKKGSGYSFISALGDSCALDQDIGTEYNIQIYTTSDHSAQQFTLENINIVDSSVTAAGKQRLLNYMGIDTSRIDLIQITTMSVKEFNTRNEDLISNYDLIYFGINSGYQVVDSDGRTKYNDTDMNGLVYTGIGDRYEIKDFLRGTAAVDYYQGNSRSTENSEYKYWYENFTDAFKGNPESLSDWNLATLNSNKSWYLKSNYNGEIATTRLMGNDITVKKMEMLLDYVKAGYPIMIPEEIYYCDTSKYVDSKTTSDKSKWRYVDVNSKLYNFIKTIKNLGKQGDEYTGLDSDNNKVFDDGYKYANIIIDKEEYAKNGRNPENLTAEQKFMGGMSYAVKRSARVDFEVIECPTEYNKTRNVLATERTDLGDGALGNVIKTTDAEYNTYNYKLKLTSSSKTLEWVKQNYGFKILIDKAGTGRFEDKYIIELEPRIKFDMATNTVELTGNWPGNMTGFMPWKIVAYNKNNPNNNFSYLGFSAFEIKEQDKKDVYVLWIKTSGSSTLDFKDLLSTYAEEMNESDLLEYNIKLVTISLSDYRNVWASESKDTQYNKNNSKIKLKTMIDKGGTVATGSGLTTISSDEKSNENIEFNMIVFGYCDSHGDLDVNSIPAQNNLAYFIESGHSILYAHDNSSFLTTMNYYTNSSNSRPSADLYWGRYNTAFLRGTLGMDAYGITYSPDYFNPESEMYDENIANTRKYLNVTNQQDYRGLVELLVFHYTSSGTGNKLYSTSQQGTSSTSITGWVHTNSVERMNQGQISEYPYVIGQELDVALTHSQYTALNMEDEELTVWYTLDSRKGNAYYKYTEGDGSNNYYIYSKGNITYTGSGHQSGSTTNEQKLFFNTVIASIKAGNFEPAVEFPEAGIDANGRYVVYHQNNDDVKITFQPIDYDAEKNTPGVFTSSKIYIDVDGVDGYSASGNDILLYDYESEKSSDWVSEIYNISNVNNKITEELKGSNLINKNKYSFIFKNSSINAYNSQIIALGKKDENGKIIDIYACPIVVEVTDAGLKNNPDEKTTARNKIYLVKTETNLFELD